MLWLPLLRSILTLQSALNVRSTTLTNLAYYTQALTLHRLARPSHIRYRTSFPPHIVPTIHIDRPLQSRRPRL